MQNLNGSGIKSSVYFWTRTESRTDNNWNISRGFLGFQVYGRLVTAHFGHAEVHKDEVGTASECLIYCCQPIVGFYHVIPQATDDADLQRSTILIVFDHKYFSASAHARENEQQLCHVRNRGWGSKLLAKKRN